MGLRILGDEIGGWKSWVFRVLGVFRVLFERVSIFGREIRRHGNGPFYFSEFCFECRGIGD